MSNEDQTDQLQQLAIQLELKISKILISFGVIFYAIYCLLQLVNIFSNLNAFTKSQFSFLKSISSDLILSRNRDKTNFLNFLDSSNKILQFANINNNTNSTCNQQYFLCDYSNASNFAPYYSIVKYLRANRHLLSESNIDSLSLFSNHGHFFLNLTQFEVNRTILQYPTQPIVVQNTNFTSISTNSYKFIRVSINQTFNLDILCSFISLNQYSLILCISYFESLTSTIGITSNFYFTQNQKQGQNSNEQNRLHQILTTHLQQLPPSRINEIFTCLQIFPSKIGKYIKNTQPLEIKCRNNKGYLLNMFGPTTTMLSYQYQLDLQVGINKHLGIFQQKKYLSTIYVSSNSTFYTNQEAIVVASLTKIRQSGYFMLLTFSIAIFILHYSNHIIQDIFLKSVDIITTLCEFLKNKQQKQFNRHLLRGYPQILMFLVTYFYQFMWIHKLRKFKGKYIYKKLLLQGLELFQEQRYGSVLKFIYLELISLQSQLVKKLFKIKQLPHKKRQMGSKCQEQQQRIHNPAVNEQRISRRRNANFNLLNPDDDELMKNISISYRGNRGVRFSNDIQTIQIDEGPVLRKSKFTEKSMVSCETIKNDLIQVENESIKRSDFNKDSLKSMKSEEESLTSLIDISRGIKKKESSTKTRSLQSIHVDLDYLKLDEQLEDDELLIDQQSEQDEIYSMNRQQITIMISETYQKVIDYYQKLLDLLANKIENQPIEEIPELANYIYVLTIMKYEKVHELLLYQTQNQMEKEYRQIIDFEDLKMLERNYNHYLSNELTQQAEVLKESILQAQHSPISLSTLQDVYCKSSVKKIRIASRYLLARAAEKLQPHLDLVVAKNVYANLKQQKTTSTVKQESLNIFMRNLQRYTNFLQQLEQLKMATQFYNTKNKKFYFLASISSIKIFTPVLSKFYELLDNFDIFNLYNLQEDIEDESQNETNQSIIMRTRKRCMSDKLKYLMDLESFIDQFTFTSDKSKDHQEKPTSSVKTIIKKRIYEKQFHEILLTIEDDEVDYSKYVVIFLGDQHNTLSSGQTEESSSSANHRPYQQKVHLQITKIIEKGYLHLILVGFSLNSYPSKYGRLKKYVKLSPELFEVQLGSKEQPQNLKRLQKYLR